jgi:hypothetical protein
MESKRPGAIVGQSQTDKDMGDDMGLLDVLNGMENGPRGQRTPGSGGGACDLDRRFQNAGRQETTDEKTVDGFLQTGG